MFSKTKSDMPASGSGNPAPSNTQQSAPAPSQAKKNSGVPSIISSDLTIRGDLESRGDIQVDGEVQGDISSQTLTIGESAVVHGGVRADTLRVCGTINGEVKATTVVLTKTAKVNGDIVHQNLTIEAGAFLEGHCRRLEPERAGGGAKVQPAGVATDTGGTTSQPAKAEA